VQLVATDLGSHLTMTRNGSAWVLASTPEPTGAFTLVATADFPKLVLPAPPKLPGVKLTLSGSLTLDVNQLTIGFTGLHSLSLDLGYTTAVRGVYGTFTFGEQSATTITMQAHASALGRTLADVDLKGVPLGNVIGNFRVASDSLGPWLQAGPRACIRLDPQPLFTTAGPTFTLPGPGTTFVTIDPEALIPDEVSDLLAVIILHRTNEISLHC
jgi:hypothetical protein